MNLRRLSAVPLAALLAALALPAAADDAATAAAAMQAIGQAAPGAMPPSGTTTKKEDNHGFRELQAPKIEKKAGSGKKSSARKRKAKPVSSKYKSTELAESQEHNYRFNENAEPIDTAKRKAAAKKKKASSSEDSDAGLKDEKPAACSDEEPCPVGGKSSDADAL